MALTVSHFHVLETSNVRDFNIFKFANEVGREHALVVFGTHLINSNKLGSYIDQTRYAKFLTEISRFYRREVQYHNDLHGSDVAQQSNFFLTKGGLWKHLHLKELDVVSVLVAALCHDLGHDGLNNTFHINA